MPTYTTIDLQTQHGGVGGAISTNTGAMKFTVPTARYLYAIRWYNNTSGNPVTGRLWSEGGAALATTGTSTPAQSAVAEAALATPYLLQPNVVYIVGFWHSNGSGNVAYASIQTGPAHAHGDLSLIDTLTGSTIDGTVPASPAQTLLEMAVGMVTGTNDAPTTPGAFSEPDAGVQYATSIAVAWGAGTDPEGGAVTYDLYFTRDNGASYTLLAGGLGSPSYTHNVAGVAASTTCWYHVYARDPAGGQSPVRQSPTFTINRTPGTPTLTSPNGGETINTTYNVTWTGGADPDGQATTIDIDLTRNNGGTWTRIVTGTPNDGTHVYDFAAVLASTACRLRLRSVDPFGAASPFDESNANFTIQHNAAPTAPSLSTPADGTTLDRAITQRFTHIFNDPDAGDTQSKFDFEYRLVGTPTWTVLTRITTTQFIDIDPSTFAVGNYERRVRTYDSQDVVSPYSVTGFFSAANVPAGPTITTPANGVVISVANAVVEWSYPSQAAYQIRRVADAAGAPNTSIIYEDTGVVESVTARTRAVNYSVNNRAEHVQIRVRDTNGLWTTYSSVRITTNYTVPATPTAATAIDYPDIAVLVTHPAPQGTQPALTTTYITRRVQGTTEETRIAVAIPTNGIYIDNKVASGVEYEYKATAVGANGTVSDSAWTL